MAAVNVHYRGQLAEATGAEAEIIDAESVRDVIRYIRKKYDLKAEKLAKAMLIAIDGESILMRKGYATKLLEGETVQFFPICGGG